MQPFSSLPTLNELAARRAAFIESGHIPPHVDPQIALSWQRVAPRINPAGHPQWKRLNAPMFERTQLQHHLLRTVALPLMEDIHQFTERADALILLLDSTLCVLDMLGKPAMMAYGEGLGAQPGVFMSESRIGTNAFAIAQIDGTPTWVYGAEHYLNHFVEVSSVAAPIFNLEGGLIGVIGLLEPVEACSIQSLGVAMMTAKAIDGQIQAELIRREASAKSTQLTSIMDAIDDGVIAWNARGKITHLNAEGGSLLGLRPSGVVGRPLVEFITLPKTIAQAAALGEDRKDVEVSFIVNGKSRNCIVSYHSIHAINETLHLAILSPIEQVRQLVNSQVGAMAHHTIDDLIGESAASQRLRRQVHAAANAHACVLVIGEQGTGKNTVVRAIHNSSVRARGPFIAMNCRAIPRDLVLSEFLGYEAGAVNSTHQRGQPSKFELVNNGTLYLDEIEALPLDMQAALLRIIEAGEVMRLGGKRAIPVNVRILASTSSDLESKVRQDAFRADLLFRLRSFVIQTVPLRERKQDIPVIIDNLLSQFGAQVGRHIKLGEAARQALLDYPWPGNIRELEAVVERALSLSDTNIITRAHLPDAILEEHLLVRSQTVEPVHSLAEAEEIAIIRAGRATKGNLSQAANILGIGRSTLWRKMKAYNLSAEDFKATSWQDSRPS